MSALPKARGLRPDYCFTRVQDITPGWLAERGLRGVLLDIDNTVTRWEHHSVLPSEMGWMHGLRDAGIALRFLSNGLPHKLAAVIEQTGIVHVAGRPMKPLPHAFHRGCRELALPVEEVLMVGDSIFTDIVGANRAGLWTCLVDPLSPVDFMGSKVWRILEAILGVRRPLHAAGDFRRPVRTAAAE